MPYHHHKIGFTHAQAHTLSHGGSIMLKHHHLHGEHEIHLTKTQLTKLHKSHAEGKGMKLHLSNAQLKHHVKHGSGFFGNILKTVKTQGVKLAKDLAKQGLQAGLNYGADKGKEFISNKINEKLGEKKEEGSGLFDWAGPLASGLNNIGNQLVDNAIPIALTAATHGGGVKKKRGRPRKHPHGGSLVAAGY